MVNKETSLSKNTIYLYLRTLLSTIVSLYTSRVVLNVLGVEDYGVYAVVGGIVTFMNFLNSAMSGASSRFITFELGRGDNKRLRDTFSSSMIIHIGIALVMIIVMETVGLWYVNTKLVIPAGTLNAANWVFQFSIFASALSITQVPYSACIVAHEHMGIYAYIEIINVVLKLIIVYLLVVWDENKLILYASLVLAVQVIVIGINRIYCIRKFKECRFKFIYKKEILRPMLSFSGWDMYGNLCVSARLQGINLVLNAFFGTIVNAAAGIANTVNGIVLGLSNNILVAFRPRIVKSYAQNNINTSLSYVYLSLKYSQMFMIVVFIPILVRAPYVINLWLGNIPEYVIGFIRIIIFSTLINLANRSIVTIIHATGKIKLISFITGTLYLLALPCAYIALREGCNPYVVYFVVLISDLFIFLSNVLITRRLVPGFSFRHLILLIFRLFVTFVICFAIVYLIDNSVPYNFAGLLFICLVSTICFCGISYLTLLTSTEKFFITNRIRHRRL